MNKLMTTVLAMLTAATTYGQNSVHVVQSGGAGNSASVTQSGDGNSVSINQTGGVTTDGSKPGNRVSLRVSKGTETTINQHNEGPNAVEISQEGQATATINQSSGTNENTITTLPASTPEGRRTRATKRRHRRS